jgi:hypothetical protein
MFLVRFQGGSEVRTQSSAPAALNIDDIIPNSFMQELKRSTTFHTANLFPI